MPHLFVNRPRLHNLGSRSLDPRAHSRWEAINATCYLLGGVIFVVGGVCFFPELSHWGDLGAWLFVVGSLFYLLVTGHDLLEVARQGSTWAHPTERSLLELAAASIYVIGTLLFILGSLCFLKGVGLERLGAWCFIVGSLLFIAGAGVNVLQILQARSLLRLQLMNLTAITFIVGSVLFAVASVPYLWTLHDPRDSALLFTYLVWLYVIGGLLFLAGGGFNAWKAALVLRDTLRERAIPPS